MPKSKPPYPPEFRARIVELARSGRTLRSVSREFGVTDTTIRSWVRQDDLDSGRHDDGLTSDERNELSQLRRENARLREERDILIWNEPSIAYRPSSSSFQSFKWSKPGSGRGGYRDG